MNQFIQLESEKYWAEVQADRNRELRRQRNAEQREQKILWAMLFAGFAALAGATAGGIFADLDVAGTVRQLAWSIGLVR